MVKITNYGGIITEIYTQYRKEKLGNIALGFDYPNQYPAGHPCFGALIGCVCNRISKARLSVFF